MKNQARIQLPSIRARPVPDMKPVHYQTKRHNPTPPTRESRQEQEAAPSQSGAAFLRKRDSILSNGGARQFILLVS